MKCQILLRNLSSRTTVKQIQQYASRFGSVVDCYLTDLPGEAFLEYHDRVSVDVFMSKRPHSIDGSLLQCQRRLPSQELQKSVKRLFIRGTVQQLTEPRLRAYFDKYGPVISCTIPKGKRNNTFTHFGYAFVAFDDDDVVDRIIQDKPHYIDEMELEIQKAEDLHRPRGRNSHSRSISRSPPPVTHSKRARRPSLSPPPPTPSSSVTMKRLRPSLEQLEEENHRLREHALMMRTQFEEDMWKLRRELDDERRRHEHLRIQYDLLRRDYARLTSDYGSSNSKHLNSKRDLSSRY